MSRKWFRCVDLTTNLVNKTKPNGLTHDFPKGKSEAMNYSHCCKQFSRDLFSFNFLQIPLVVRLILVGPPKRVCFAQNKSHTLQIKLS